MSVTELMNDLAARGIEVRAVDDRVRYRPRASMTPELADRIREHKAEVLALLHREGAATVRSDGAWSGSSLSQFDEFLQTVIDTFDGVVVEEEMETAPILPERPHHGEPPQPSPIAAMRQRKDRMGRVGMQSMGKRRSRRTRVTQEEGLYE